MLKRRIFFKKKYKHCLLIGILVFSFHFTLRVSGQIPPGYYDAAQGQTGQNLRSALHNIIDDHNPASYSALWNHFMNTDAKSNGKVWDMYSDDPGGTPPYEFTFIADQCGNYSTEGDCYNREHSFPGSWFNDNAPMYTDLFHLVPTDGYVNNRRSNYPYGEVGSATWTSLNGSKLGSCSYPGYSGVVFEPIDAYKGDFARGYFYMLTRYMDVSSTFNSPMLTQGDFTDWAISLLLDWHHDDPVSPKETNRNNEIYTIQGNRNPFIDHPEWACDIWGDFCYYAPEFTSTPVTTCNVYETYSYEITVSAYDPGQTTISCPILPSWLTYSSTGNTSGTLSGVPDNTNTGQHAVQLMAFDNTDTTYQNFSITVNQGQANMNISVSNLEDFGDVPNGGMSEFKSYEISAQTLTDTLLITSPEGFEISWSEFINYDTLLKFSGYSAGKTLYVRFVPDHTGYFSGDIVHELSGLTPIAVHVSGNCISGSTPQITLSTSNLGDFGNIDIGSSSSTKEYLIQASNLTSALHITTSHSDFKLSTAPNGAYTDSISLSHINGQIDMRSVFVKFFPSDTGVIEGFCIHSATNAYNQLIHVSGTGKDPNGIFSDEMSDLDFIKIYQNNHGQVVFSADHRVGKIISINIYNISGARKSSYYQTDSKKRSNILLPSVNLTPGLYVFQIITEDSLYHVKHFVR